MLITVGFLQNGFHLVLIGVGRHVAYFLPANGHYAFFVKLIPVGGIVARGIDPIVNSGHIIICHSAAIVLIVNRGNGRNLFVFPSFIFFLWKHICIKKRTGGDIVRDIFSQEGSGDGGRKHKDSCRQVKAGTDKGYIHQRKLFGHHGSAQVLRDIRHFRSNRDCSRDGRTKLSGLFIQEEFTGRHIRKLQHIRISRHIIIRRNKKRSNGCPGNREVVPGKLQEASIFTKASVIRHFCRKFRQRFLDARYGPGLRQRKFVFIQPGLLGLVQQRLLISQQEFVFIQQKQFFIQQEFVFVQPEFIRTFRGQFTQRRQPQEIT